MRAHRIGDEQAVERISVLVLGRDILAKEAVENLIETSVLFVTHDAGDRADSSGTPDVVVLALQRMSPADVLLLRRTHEAWRPVPILALFGEHVPQIPVSSDVYCLDISVVSLAEIAALLRATALAGRRRRGYRHEKGTHVHPLLTPMQTRVLELLMAGGRTGDIARTMNLTPQTVKSYVRAIYLRLGVGSRAEAVAVAKTWLSIPTSPTSPDAEQWRYDRRSLLSHGPTRSNESSHARLDRTLEVPIVNAVGRA